VFFPTKDDEEVDSEVKAIVSFEHISKLTVEVNKIRAQPDIRYLLENRSQH
jgi:hypothetical protein